MPNNRHTTAKETSPAALSNPSRQKRKLADDQYETLRVSVKDMETNRKRYKNFKEPIEQTSPVIESFINFRYPFALKNRQLALIEESYMLVVLANCLQASYISRYGVQKVMAYDILKMALMLCSPNNTAFIEVIKGQMTALEQSNTVDNYRFFRSPTSTFTVVAEAKARSMRELLTGLVDEIKSYVPAGELDQVIAQLQQVWLSELIETKDDMAAKESDPSMCERNARPSVFSS